MSATESPFASSQAADPASMSDPAFDTHPQPTTSQAHLSATCPGCGFEGEHAVHTRATDHTVSGEQFAVALCPSCALLHTLPRPEGAALDRYYDSPDYISHTSAKRNLMERLYNVGRGWALKQKIALIQRHSPKPTDAKPMHLLDVGAGTGHFLAEARQNGYTVTGVEPSAAARQVAERSQKIALLTEDSLGSLPDGRFDVITLWHVLEHVPAPQARLAELHRLLSPTGILCIAVPNPQSADASHYGPDWAAWDVPRHLNHFMPNVMRGMGAKAGLKSIATKGLVLDAFYIALLSERYRTGETRWLPAIQQGLASNAKARRHSDTWSSQVYLFKRG